MSRPSLFSRALFALLASLVVFLSPRSSSAEQLGTIVVVEQVGPPRPYWLGSRRGIATQRLAVATTAALEGAHPDDWPIVKCDPTCATVALRTRNGPLGYAPHSESAAKRAFSRSSLAGELSGADDLHLISVSTRGGVWAYAFARGALPLACDCAVDVWIDERGEVVRMEGRKLLGYGTLPGEPRYTRGEALAAALRQLVAEEPSLTDPNGLESPELSSLIVVPVADRAVLAHRIALTLDHLPYAVDVDDATLAVVRVGKDRRFDRVTTISYEQPFTETVTSPGWQSAE